MLLNVDKPLDGVRGVPCAVCCQCLLAWVLAGAVEPSPCQIASVADRVYLSHYGSWDDVPDGLVRLERALGTVPLPFLLCMHACMHDCTEVRNNLLT